MPEGEKAVFEPEEPVGRAPGPNPPRARKIFQDGEESEEEELMVKVDVKPDPVAQVANPEQVAPVANPEHPDDARKTWKTMWKTMCTNKRLRSVPDAYRKWVDEEEGEFDDVPPFFYTLPMFNAHIFIINNPGHELVKKLRTTVTKSWDKAAGSNGGDSWLNELSEAVKGINCLLFADGSPLDQMNALLSGNPETVLETLTSLFAEGTDVEVPDHDSECAKSNPDDDLLPALSQEEMQVFKADVRPKRECTGRSKILSNCLNEEVDISVKHLRKFVQTNLRMVRGPSETRLEKEGDEKLYHLEINNDNKEEVAKAVKNLVDMFGMKKGFSIYTSKDSVCAGDRMLRSTYSNDPDGVKLSVFGTINHIILRMVETMFEQESYWVSLELPSEIAINDGNIAGTLQLCGEPEFAILCTKARPMQGGLIMYSEAPEQVVPLELKCGGDVFSCIVFIAPTTADDMQEVGNDTDFRIKSVVLQDKYFRIELHPFCTMPTTKSTSSCAVCNLNAKDLNTAGNVCRACPSLRCMIGHEWIRGAVFLLDSIKCPGMVHATTVVELGHDSDDSWALPMKRKAPGDEKKAPGDEEEESDYEEEESDDEEEEEESEEEESDDEEEEEESEEEESDDDEEEQESEEEESDDEEEGGESDDA